MLDEADDDGILVETLRETVILNSRGSSYFWKLISIFRLDASSGIRSNRSCTFV